MDHNQKTEHLKFIIQRYDGYYDSINNKGNLYLAICTFTLGSIILGYNTLDEKFHFGVAELLLFILSLAFNAASLFFTILAIRPYLSSVSEAKKSLVYFCDVACTPEKEHSVAWTNINDEDFNVDLCSQTHLLAKGLTDKFKKLRIATSFIALQMMAIIVFGIYLLTL